MTDQTRWGIHEVQTRNKAIKYRRDLVARAIDQKTARRARKARRCFPGYKSHAPLRL